MMQLWTAPVQTYSMDSYILLAPIAGFIQRTGRIALM
jgi:hypothetical protein